jgi:hypothetical protein
VLFHCLLCASHRVNVLTDSDREVSSDPIAQAEGAHFQSGMSILTPGCVTLTMDRNYTCTRFGLRRHLSLIVHFWVLLFIRIKLLLAWTRNGPTMFQKYRHDMICLNLVDNI